VALTTQRIDGDGAGAGVRTGAPGIEAPPRRRARLPEVALGVLLMVGFSLAAVLWHMSATERVPVLALAGEVARGEVIEPGDLLVVYLGADQPVAHLPRGAAGELVGRVAVADLPAGTVLTRSHVVARSPLGPGDGVVGLALDPGQFPAMGLVPGDVVNVVTAAPTGAPDEAQAGEGSAGVLARRAEVYAVEPLGTQGRLFVSLRMPEAVANAVAAAAEGGPVRLVLVGR
jgi:hypothetical protein